MLLCWHERCLWFTSLVLPWLLVDGSTCHSCVHTGLASLLALSALLNTAPSPRSSRCTLVPQPPASLPRLGPRCLNHHCLSLGALGFSAELFQPLCVTVGRPKVSPSSALFLFEESITRPPFSAFQPGVREQLSYGFCLLSFSYCWL